MKISFLTTYFRDTQWLRLWLNRVLSNTPERLIGEIVIVDQDRTPSSVKTIRGLAASAKILQFPRSEAHFRLLGHDHPAVLNQAVRQCSCELICVWDSDAHPISPNWFAGCAALLQQYNAVLAQHPDHPGFSHPCFMLFKRMALPPSLAFDERIFEDSLPWYERDTGRQIALQIARSGGRVFLAEPERAFGGQWGHLYLGTIYHHGHGSFQHGEERLRRQVNWKSAFFRRRVFKGRYQLSSRELWNLRIRAGVRRRLIRFGLIRV